MVRPIQTPIDRVGEILFEKINSDRFMLSVHQLLAMAVEKSREILIDRNEIIDELHKAALTKEQLLYLYVGLRQPDGKTDERYPSLANALLREANDVIILGVALAERLANYSKTIALRFGTGAAKPATMSTVQLENRLMPDAKGLKLYSPGSVAVRLHSR